MSGRLVALALIVPALLIGAAIWYLQVYAYYSPVTLADAPVTLVPLGKQTPERIVAENFEAIDAASSPLRFRSCFTTPLSLGLLTETYRVVGRPTPLVAPGWFTCFDAGAIGAALDTGEAIAFLSEANLAPGVDRVIAVFPDGRAYGWNELNGSLEE